MKKSMIAATVVATAFAASANAGWFNIVNQTGNGTGTLPASGSQMDVNNISSAVITTPGTNTLQTLSSAQFSAIETLIGGGSLANDTVHYFGMENAAAGPAYFGIYYKATAGISLQINLDSDYGNPDGVGAYSAVYDGSTYSAVGSYAFGVFSSTSPITLSAGETMIAVFAGLMPGSAISGSINASSGGTFGINYLTYNGSAYASMGSQTGASSSNLNIATYAIPVPAPALLAGAGLVGAAALRRRMVKKA